MADVADRILRWTCAAFVLTLIVFPTYMLGLLAGTIWHAARLGFNGYEGMLDWMVGDTRTGFVRFSTNNEQEDRK